MMSAPGESSGLWSRDKVSRVGSVVVARRLIAGRPATTPTQTSTERLALFSRHVFPTFVEMMAMRRMMSAEETHAAEQQSPEHEQAEPLPERNAAEPEQRW